MNESSALATLGNIFVDPAKAYDAIHGHNRWLWYPLILTILAGLALVVIYFTTVDIGWLFQQQMAAHHVQMTPEQIQAAARFQSRTTVLIIGSVGAVLGPFVVYLLSALYYFLVGKVAGYEVQGYGSWFSFAAWSNFPAILVALISIAVYLLRGSHQVDIQTLNITGLNPLLFHLQVGSPWYGLVNSLNLLTFWVLGLSVFGLARWTKRSTTHAAIVVLAPFVLIYGIWILIKLV